MATTYLTGSHWPVIVTEPDEDGGPYLETVTAPTYAAAVEAAEFIYQGSTHTQVVPIPVAEHISGPDDIVPPETPPVIHLAQALLAAHAPGHVVTSTEDMHEDRLAVMRIAAEAMRDSAAVIAEQPGEWSRLESLADRIRALPLPADNKDEGAEPCRSFTTLGAIETYCEHDSGDGHGGLHYAVVNGKTHTWTDDAPAQGHLRPLSPAAEAELAAAGASHTAARPSLTEANDG